jgi:GWxTD domain-containing protein
MMNRARLTIALCLTVFTVPLFAQLSAQYRDWGDTAVQFLMTRQEKADWQIVKDDDRAQAFIDSFWSRREPASRKQIEERIAIADKRYRSGRTPGSLTDHGLVYVLLGEPTDILHRVSKLAAVPTATPEFQRPINVETWIYRQLAAERVVGTKSFDIAFVFQDEKHASEYELDGSSRISFESMALGIAKSVYKAAQAPERIAAIRLIVVSDSTLAHDILRRAQEGEDFAALARKYSSHHSAQQGGYLGRMPFADLDDDFRSALEGKEAGSAVLIERKPMFAIVRLLTEGEAEAAEGEMR